MKSKTTNSRVSDADRPLYFDELIRMHYEPPTEPQPDAMRSFVGLSGITFERSNKAERHGVSFTPIDTHGNSLAWALSTTHAYRLGLPVLDRKIIPRGSRCSRPNEVEEIS